MHYLNEGKLVHHYSNFYGNWRAVVSVKFDIEFDKIDKATYPKAVMVWFIHKDAISELADVYNNYVNEEKKGSETLKKIRDEQHREWLYLQEKQKEKIDSFSL